MHADLDALTQDRIVRDALIELGQSDEEEREQPAILGFEGQQRADASRVVITGVCGGGRIVWLYSAHNPQLLAGAAWYGRLVGAPRDETPRHPVDIAGETHAPVLGLYGSEDRGIPLETVDTMRRKLSEGGGSDEIVVFPAAPHAFHADYRDSYRPLAATEAWQQMIAWFRKHGAT